MKIFIWKKTIGCKTEKELYNKNALEKVILSNYIWNWNFLLSEIN